MHEERQKSFFSGKIKNIIHLERSFSLVWKASRIWTLASLALTVLEGILPLFSLYIIKLIVDTATLSISSPGAGGDGSSGRKIAVLIILAAVIAVVVTTVRLLGRYISEVQAAVVTDYVASVLHDKSTSLDLAYYENPDYYDTLHRAQREGPYRPTQIVHGIVSLVQNGVSLLAMMGLLFVFHWSVGLMLIISTLPGLAVQLFFARINYNWQQERTQLERKTGYLSSVLTSTLFAKEIRLFDLGGHFAATYNGLRLLLRNEKLDLSRKRSVADFFAQSFAVVVLFGCLFFIARDALHGKITVGDMVMYFQAFQRGTTSLKAFLTSMASLYEDNMFVSYFFDFLDIKNTILDPPDPVPVPASLVRGIRFDKVHFRYPGARDPVLQDMSLEIRRGEVVALVGANGAGKSTIVKLLCRLYDPDSGQILLDGVPLQDFAVKDLRRQISVVFQDYARYFATVGDNIRFGDITGQHDPQEIADAARKANADGFIDKLPHGYDTMLGRWFTDGEELSLGEWQKIVLARAFLRKAPFIVLDEPTASLDILTEYHLFTKFRELIAGNAALLISHRFSTVRMADRIYVIANGKIAEEGTHEQLIASHGLYADLYEKQAAWMQANPNDHQLNV